jgi:hypothetical protein
MHPASIVVANVFEGEVTSSDFCPFTLAFTNCLRIATRGGAAAGP